jgi:hypothetical protein
MKVIGTIGKHGGAEIVGRRAKRSGVPSGQVKGRALVRENRCRVSSGNRLMPTFAILFIMI